MTQTRARTAKTRKKIAWIIREERLLCRSGIDPSLESAKDGPGYAPARQS
jgi:hypothetical protein